MADEFWKEKDIIKYVQKIAPQFSEKKIRAHLRAYIDIIKRLAEEKDVMSIALNHVGVLHIKKDRIRANIKNTRDPEVRDKYQQYLDWIREAERTNKRRIQHSKKFFLRNKREVRGLSWEEIEDKQNEKNGSDR